MSRDHIPVVECSALSLHDGTQSCSKTALGGNLCDWTQYIEDGKTCFATRPIISTPPLSAFEPQDHLYSNSTPSLRKFSRAKRADVDVDDAPYPSECLASTGGPVSPATIGGHAWACMAFAPYCLPARFGALISCRRINPSTSPRLAGPHREAGRGLPSV